MLIFPFLFLVFGASGVANVNLVSRGTDTLPRVIALWSVAIGVSISVIWFFGGMSVVNAVLLTWSGGIVGTWFAFSAKLHRNGL